jgi:ABC-type Fe3+ transport system substrate-binding protein
MDKPPHPNASKVFINWLLSRDGQTAVQKDGETNDSLRVDITKSGVRPTVRRKDRGKYMVTWKAEWMDTEPMQKVVDQALAKTSKKP